MININSFLKYFINGALNPINFFKDKYIFNNDKLQNLQENMLMVGKDIETSFTKLKQNYENNENIL